MRNLIAGFCLSAVVFIVAFGTTAMTSSGDDPLPAGTIMAWGGGLQAIPSDWKVCNGQSLSRKKYPELFAAIGTSWGSPNSKRFNLPDLRGLFLRGVDAGSGCDPEVNKRKASKPGGNDIGVGSMQDDSVQNHTHRDSGHSHQDIHYHPSGDVVSKSTSDVTVITWVTDSSSENTGKADLRGVAKFGTKSNARAGEESRPKNAAVYYIIKVR